ncbi:MAG TPA: LuxR C-terminal-related transcriptional regulator, partial [Pilimelia sp.]|nr:LuxR C-terminal-related transcriptional regulator [Pilimelia sp.]
GQPRPVTLVLDEVFSLAGSQWADDLDFVLRHSEGRLRLVLVGRSDPPFPLYRYRLAGTLGEVGGDDLAFLEAEAAELLSLHGIDLAPAALASLLRHTEGWAAGLRLFAMVLEGHDDAERVLATISGDESTIAEYFVGEVLRAQPAELREFLLRTGVLDAVTPDLARALTGRADAGRVLGALARENVFVQAVSDRPAVYRYHRLFAELLRAELAKDDAAQIPALHRRAAEWFAAEGRTADAVGHAVLAGDWAMAAACVIDHCAVGQLVLGGATGLGGLFRGMPEAAASPECALVTAALALAEGDLDAAAKQLARAEELLAAGVPERGTMLTLAATLLDALLAGASCDRSRMLDSARAAERLLAGAPVELLERHPELRALALTAVGTAQSWSGALGAAAATLADAADAATAGGCEALRADCLQHLALLAAYRGNLRLAEATAGQAVELAGPDGGRGTRPAVAHVVLAWVATEHYDLEVGWRHLRAAEHLCRGRAGGLAETGLALVRARLLRARGEVRKALQTVQQLDSGEARPMPDWLAREVALTRARTLIAGGQPAEALATLGDLTGEDGQNCSDGPDVAVVRSEALHADGDLAGARRALQTALAGAEVPVPVLVAAWMMHATLALDAAEVGTAQHALRQALRLAGPEAQRRPFNEVGVRLRRMLRDNQDLAARYEALGRNGPAAHPPRPTRPATDPARPVIVQKLSRREMEVLRHVEAMLPTEEIAGAMYVSVNTVKTHVRSILRKLAASRRNEAVRRARDLGLI